MNILVILSIAFSLMAVGNLILIALENRCYAGHEPGAAERMMMKALGWACGAYSYGWWMDRRERRTSTAKGARHE